MQSEIPGPQKTSTVPVERLYIVRQPGKADREFSSSKGAVEYLVANPGAATLFADGELVMSRGFWPHEA